MKRDPFAFLPCVAFVLLSASFAVAQGPGGQGGYGGGRDMLNALRNADGAIDLSKASSEIPEFILERVKAADKNGDGLLDAQEEQVLASARGGRARPSSR